MLIIREPEAGSKRKRAEIDCATCGIIFAAGDFTSHVETCFDKIESQMVTTDKKGKTAVPARGLKYNKVGICIPSILTLTAQH